MIHKSFHYPVPFGRPGKALALAGLVALFVLEGLFAGKDREGRVRRVTRCARRLLRVLGIRAIRKGALPDGPALLAANHVSYLDILLLASQKPAVFLPSVEVLESRLQGLLAGIGGSLFVERRRRSSARGDVERISTILADGLSVALFPEGTTSDGQAVLPFRTALFEAARASRAPVVPICIRYTEVNGKAPDIPARDAVSYYGDMTLMKQLWKLLALKNATVELTVLEPIPSRGLTRKDLAFRSREAIVSLHRPLVQNL